MPEHVLIKKIEIAAPPAVVREKFLQFDQIPKYHPNGFFKSIGTVVPNDALKVGTKLRVVIEIATMEPPIIENSPTTFCWAGKGFLGTFNGNHSFHFTESQVTKGGTTFIQEEKFDGMLTFMIGEGAIGKMLGIREKTINGFEGFNQDFKKWVEGGK